MIFGDLVELKARELLTKKFKKHTGDIAIVLELIEIGGIYCERHLKVFWQKSLKFSTIKFRRFKKVKENVHNQEVS